MLFNPFNRFVLMDPEPGQGGGNGAPAGGAPNPGAAFDPAAFKADILGEITKTFNGFAAAVKRDMQKLTPQQQATSGDGNSGGNSSQDPEPQPGNGQQAKTPEQIALQRQLATLQRQIEEATNRSKTAEQTATEERTKRLEAQRDRVVAESLAGFQFANPESGKDARRLFAADLKWTEEGELVGPDGYTKAEDYIKAQISARPNWLAPKPVDTAGARAANGSGNGGKRFDLDELTPEAMAKMPLERKREWEQAIAQSLRG